MTDQDIRESMIAYVERVKPCAFPPRIDPFLTLPYADPLSEWYSHAARVFYAAVQGYGGTRASCIVVRTHAGEYQEYTP